MKVIITGTGASGTSYIAKVLCDAGLKCGHEAVYTAHHGSHSLKGPKWKHWEADSSWMAAPFLAAHEGPRFLQVRDPIKTIHSLLRLRAFDLTHWSIVIGPYRAVKKRYARDVWKEATEIDRCAAYWCHWNEMALPYVERWWRVEDVDAELLADILTAAGKKPNAKRIASALAGVPTNHNSHHLREYREASWELLAPQMAERVRTLADRFGYA